MSPIKREYLIKRAFDNNECHFNYDMWFVRHKPNGKPRYTIHSKRTGHSTEVTEQYVCDTISYYVKLKIFSIRP